MRIVAARDPHFFPEHGIAHHRPERLLLWEADEPNHVEDVTIGDRRRNSPRSTPMSASSSRRCTPSTTIELDSFDRRIRDRLADLGRPHGFDAAEVFHLMTDL